MMIVRDLRFLFAAAAFVCSMVPAIASGASDASDRPKCSRPEYPRASIRREEEGVTMLGFLIRSDGTVGRSVILNSSGSQDLDRAAADALSKCVFKPGSTDGQPIESWVAVEYVWSISDDPGLSRAQYAAARAAIKGDVAARYHLSLILSLNAKTDAERQHALAVMRSAADKGFAQAQYDLGRRYEKGTGLPANPDEALRWYQQAADQGHVLAVQRLRVGALLD